MATPQTILYSITFIANICLSGFFFFSPKLNKIKLFFALTTLSVGGWVATLYLLYHAQDVIDLLFIGRLNYVFVQFIFLFLLLFSLHFPSVSVFRTKLSEILFGSWTVLLAIVTLFTNLVIENEIWTGTKLETSFGDLFFLVLIQFAVFMFFFVRNFVTKLTTLTGVERRQVIFVLIGILISVVFTTFTNLVMPLLGNYSIQYFGPFFSLFFILFVLYSIHKHHLFETKLIGIELMVFVLIMLTLIRTVLSSSVSDLVFNALIFAITVPVSIFLVKAILVEIKNRNRLEKANRILEAENELKTELVSTVMHQLRSPITAIRGYASMMLEGSFGQIQSDFNKPLQTISTSSADLAKIIDEFLNYRKLKSGDIALNKERVDLRLMVQDIADEYQPRANQAGLQFIIEIDETHSEYLLDADKVMIKEAIKNLVDNAFKYTKEGWVKISLTRQDEKILISVRDSGMGMKGETINKLFHEFYRSDNADAVNVSGFGLGLFIVKTIVEHHNGRVLVSSEGLGKGSIFSIEV
jgi:signal transduction histidine kinase